MPKSIKSQAKKHQKPTQKDLVRGWLLNGERLNVITARERTNNPAFHLFGRIHELRKDGFRFAERNIPVTEGDPLKEVWLHPEFADDIDRLGLAWACLKERQRQALEKELGEVA